MCADLLDTEAIRNSRSDDVDLGEECTHCCAYKKELKLARKRIAELTAELSTAKRAKTASAASTASD